MIVVGMDEVGRGSWAGPVVVGAVALSETITGLRDSKQLNVKKREILAEVIRADALAWNVGEASAGEIDTLGLTAALSLAYQRALAGIALKIDQIVLDGAYNFLPGDPRVKVIVKADQTVPAVSAASIVAKVYRDHLMAELANGYSGYGFDKHVGYGTASHARALRELGPSPIHRLSFAPVRSARELMA